MSLHLWQIWEHIVGDSEQTVTIPASHPQAQMLTDGHVLVHQFLLRGDPLDPEVSRTAFEHSQRWQDL